jgi:hypothetical protein
VRYSSGVPRATISRRLTPPILYSSFQRRGVEVSDQNDHFAILMPRVNDARKLTCDFDGLRNEVVERHRCNVVKGERDGGDGRVGSDACCFADEVSASAGRQSGAVGFRTRERGRSRSYAPLSISLWISTEEPESAGKVVEEPRDLVCEPTGSF